jgi:hypothetical protein
MYRANLEHAINEYNFDAPFLFMMRIAEHNCYIQRNEKTFYLMTRNGRHLSQSGMTLSAPNGPCDMPEMVFNWLRSAGFLAAANDANTIFELTEKARSIFSHKQA